MKTVSLKRVISLPYATLGALFDGGTKLGVTCERPWLSNRPQESCIPVGKYQVLRCSNSPDYGYKPSAKFGDTFQVFDVPGRGNILFHKGNTSLDSHGCILVGEDYAVFGEVAGVANSTKAYTAFMRYMKNEREFTLVVEDFLP